MSRVRWGALQILNLFAFKGKNRPRERKSLLSIVMSTLKYLMG